MAHLYQSLASRVASNINQGVYQPGDRLPGVRVLSRNEGVSPSTVVAAYEQLESDGYVESRPRSGFYVRSRRVADQAEPGLSQPTPRPKAVTGQQLVAQLVHQAGKQGVVQLGANIPSETYLPTAALSRELRGVARRYASRLSDYEVPPGLPKLRGLVAQHMAQIGCVTHPDEIMITNGCQEAVYLSLKCVTQPGDVVAVESPTYYGLLQVLDSLGLKALEIPTHSRTGLSVEALQLALEQWPIKACVFIPNYSNPLGALMPEAQKLALMKLLRKYPHVAVIEDDIYGDLCFGNRRPSTLKSKDQHDQVLYCSSYSKSLSAGMRIGWVLAPKYQERLMHEKFVTNCSNPVANQLAIAALLEKGRYERHLRSMRLALAQNVARLSEKVLRHFPDQVRISRPEGGLSIWVELPKAVDTTELFNQAAEFDVSIAPGQIFSTNPRKYRHCLRLNAGVEWNDALETGIEKLGGLLRS